MTDTSLYRLTNAEFDFEYNGKVYHVRKANLDKAAQYQQKVSELATAKDPLANTKIVAFCISLVLRDYDETITPEHVMQNAPADIDPMECLTTLGFLNPKQLEATRKLQEAVTKKIAGDASSS